jgi:uncharacterized protein with PQ loop repeat
MVRWFPENAKLISKVSQTFEVFICFLYLRMVIILSESIISSLYLWDIDSVPKEKKENEVNLSELQICTIAFNCLLMQTIAVCQYLDLQLKHTITCKNVRVLLCTLIALWSELSVGDLESYSSPLNVEHLERKKPSNI